MTPESKERFMKHWYVFVSVFLYKQRALFSSLLWWVDASQPLRKHPVTPTSAPAGWRGGSEGKEENLWVAIKTAEQMKQSCECKPN